jgi:hypothetical protein
VGVGVRISLRTWLEGLPRGAIGATLALLGISLTAASIGYRDEVGESSAKLIFGAGLFLRGMPFVSFSALVLAARESSGRPSLAIILAALGRILAVGLVFGFAMAAQLYFSLRAFADGEMWGGQLLWLMVLEFGLSVLCWRSVERAFFARLEQRTVR